METQILLLVEIYDLSILKGSNKAVVYESGFVWGAKVNGEIRVSGSTHNQRLNA